MKETFNPSSEIERFTNNKDYISLAFFDINAKNSPDFIEAVQKNFAKNQSSDGVYICSPDDYSIISRMEYHSEWPSKLQYLNDELEKNGKYFGLIMIDEFGSWCIYQENPVSDGFIFFRENFLISEDLSDFVYTCDEIRQRLTNGFYEKDSLDAKKMTFFLENLCKSP
ncbi:MAG: hypothetical protein WA154_01895 [Moraxellaceae bacterium]